MILLLFACEVKARLELLKALEQRLPWVSFRDEYDSVTDFLDKYFGAHQFKRPRQPHRLISPGLEEFCGFHDWIRDQHKCFLIIYHFCAAIRCIRAVKIVALPQISACNLEFSYIQ